MVGEAKRLEEAGAALLNFTNSGPVVGAAVAQAVSIPVLGGFGGGPWLDGRMRMAHRGDRLQRRRHWTTHRTPTPTSHRSRSTRSPAYAEDVRSARQISGGIRGLKEAARRMSDMSLTSARLDGGDRRHRHPLRGGRIRAAAADVLAGWIQRDHGELGDARAAISAPRCWRDCGSGSPASPSTSASRADPVAGWSGSRWIDYVGPGHRAARPPRPRAGSRHGRVCRLLDRRGAGDGCIPSGSPSAVLFPHCGRGAVSNETAREIRRAPGFRGRRGGIGGGDRAPAANGDAGFSDDGRLGPWVSVLRSDASFARALPRA